MSFPLSAANHLPGLLCTFASQVLPEVNCCLRKKRKIKFLRQRGASHCIPAQQDDWQEAERRRLDAPGKLSGSSAATTPQWFKWNELAGGENPTRARPRPRLTWECSAYTTYTIWISLAHFGLLQFETRCLRRGWCSWKASRSAAKRQMKEAHGAESRDSLGRSVRVKSSRD